MKLIYVIINLILFVLNVHTQTILTSQNNPVIGESVLNMICDTTGVTPGPSGANVIWNFTGLQIIDTAFLAWVSPSATPNGSLFPNSNIASNNNNSEYIYHIVNTGGIIVNGYASGQLIIPYTDNQIVFTWPFTYNSVVTDTYTATHIVNNYTTYRKGTSTTTGDAWGTLNLPYGQFSNALRVRINNNFRDSARIGFISYVVNTTQTIHQWYVPGKKFPVFEINTVLIVPPIGNPTYMKTVSYNQNSPQIGIKSISNNIPDEYMLGQNYPNPFNPETKIQFAVSNEGNIKLLVYNSLGEAVETLIEQNLSPGLYEIDWDAAKFSGGIYFYSIYVNDKLIMTRKMILAK